MIVSAVVCIPPFDERKMVGTAVKIDGQRIGRVVSALRDRDKVVLCMEIDNALHFDVDDIRLV